MFPYSTLLGATVDTCLASVYEAFLKMLTLFLRGGPWEMTAWFDSEYMHGAF